MAANERRVIIPGPSALQGVVHGSTLQPARGGVVVCHPHPHLGGDMEYPVVVAIANELAGRGWWALRFNFRGAGDDWRDVHAALAYLRGQTGDAPLAIAGYSYGAMMALTAAARSPESVVALCLVGLPIQFRGLSLPDLAPLRSSGLPVFAVAGDNDEYGPPAKVRAALAPVGDAAVVHTLAGADHFYLDHRDDVARLIAAFLEGELAKASTSRRQ